MLSRHSNAVSGRPRRAKSTSSIKPQLTEDQYAGFGGELAARQYAVTAAEIAYERANERYLGAKDEKGAKTSNPGKERSNLAYQKSIRFAGPSAVPLRSHSITCRTVPAITPLSKAQNPPWDIESHETDAKRPNTRSLAAESLFGVENFDEYGFASQPSSYRRLRKTKSMFMPGKQPSAIFPAGVPKAGRHFQRQSVRSSDSCGESVRVPDPRLRKSFSFIRGVTERLPTITRQHATNDEVVQLARDQFVADLEKQRLKEHSSLFDHVRRHKPRKAFRRTLRTTSTNSYSSAVASPNAAEESLHSSGLVVKARTFSQNLRRKLKNVLGRSVGESVALPIQHLDASRAHFGGGISPADQDSEFYPPIPSPDVELLRRISSRETLGHNALNLASGDPGLSSIRSVPSQEDISLNKSRVTSWTDSTAANTIHVPFVVERKRLSVIKEDGGPHQPSSASRVHDGISNGYPAFRQPYRQDSAGTPPEPQRIFSALQREIVKRKSHGDIDSSDSDIESSQDQTRSTRAFATQEQSVDRHYLHQGPFSLPYQHVDFAEATDGLTQQQVATLNESCDALPKRPLHEVGSAFFHANKHIEQKRGRSPYRRATRSSTEDDPILQNDTSDVARTADEALMSQPLAAKYHFSQATRSESIYSRTSGIRTPKTLGSSVSLVRHESNEEPGTAIILATEAAQHRNGESHLRQQRDVSHMSNKSSGECKERLASDMAYFNDQFSEDKTIYNALPVKESGHKRESAQINGDETEIGKFHSTDQPPPQPLGFLRSDSKIHLMGEEKSSLNKPNTMQQTENTPLTRPPFYKQGSLRPESGREYPNPYDVSHNLRSTESQDSLKERDGNVIFPRAPSKRYSPERAQRLQRLKNKSLLSLHEATSSTQSGNRSGFLMESKSVQNTKASPSSLWLRGSALKENSPSPDLTPKSQSDSKHLVDSFLKDRRREVRISEENGSSPAFL